jgi:hypothetical protein
MLSQGLMTIIGARVSGCAFTACASAGTDSAGTEISIPFPPQVGEGVGVCWSPPEGSCPVNRDNDSVFAGVGALTGSVSRSGQACLTVGASWPPLGVTASNGKL